MKAVKDVQAMRLPVLVPVSSAENLKPALRALMRKGGDEHQLMALSIPVARRDEKQKEKCGRRLVPAAATFALTMAVQYPCGAYALS
jgi:hypothetical protein